MSIIEEIYNLDDGGSQVLYSGRRAEVRQYRHYRWLNIDGYLIQSIMDLEHPGKLLNPVNGYMLGGLAFIKEPANVLNLGFGGGVFERYFQHNLPAVMVHSVEINEEIIHLAREFFGFDAGYPVYLQSAQDYMAHHSIAYDLILCDIFIQESHPPCLKDESFYNDCRRNLSATGVMVINLVPADEQALIEILLTLRKSFAFNAILKIPDHSNILVYASGQEFLNGSCNSSGGKGPADGIPDDFYQLVKPLPDLSAM
ncbi:MAG: hypothetical protein MI673_04455 [Thiotrichales bacterium]|nr:hypothetical protein [Thiotrichales bacterium]